MAYTFKGSEEITALLKNWNIDNNNLKNVFKEFKDQLLSMENAVITFRSRPGVSYSLRGSIKGIDKDKDRLFVMVDVIDDDPESRWLSVCFYESTITDEDELGDLIPGGLLGEDGYCFDMYDNEDNMAIYLKERISEAYESTINLVP